MKRYDSQKYKEVWNLSMERMKDSVQQALKADKVIHEQLLHLLWYNYYYFITLIVITLSSIYSFS